MRASRRATRPYTSTATLVQSPTTMRSREPRSTACRSRKRRSAPQTRSRLVAFACGSTSTGPMLRHRRWRFGHRGDRSPRGPARRLRLRARCFLSRFPRRHPRRRQPVSHCQRLLPRGESRSRPRCRHLPRPQRQRPLLPSQPSRRRPRNPRGRPCRPRGQRRRRRQRRGRQPRPRLLQDPRRRQPQPRRLQDPRRRRPQPRLLQDPRRRPPMVCVRLRRARPCRRQPSRGLRPRFRALDRRPAGGQEARRSRSRSSRRWLLHRPRW